MDIALDSVRPLIRTRQYREFTTEPLTDDQLRTLAEVARWTGSGNNSQPCRFVVVTDVPVLRQIAKIALPQTYALRTAIAALAISLPHNPHSEVMPAYDEGRAAERILIAASMLNLGAGITWIREKFRPEIDQLLGVGDDRFVRTIVALGHPTEAARAPRSAPGKARLPLDELLSWR